MYNILVLRSCQRLILKVLGMTYICLEPKWPLFWSERAFFLRVQPPNQSTNRFQVYKKKQGKSRLNSPKLSIWKAFFRQSNDGNLNIFLVRKMTSVQLDRAQTKARRIVMADFLLHQTSKWKKGRYSWMRNHTIWCRWQSFSWKSAVCSDQKIKHCLYMDVSENSGTPKSSILIGFPL